MDPSRTYSGITGSLNFCPRQDVAETAPEASCSGTIGLPTYLCPIPNQNCIDSIMRYRHISHLCEMRITVVAETRMLRYINRITGVQLSPLTSLDRKAKTSASSLYEVPCGQNQKMTHERNSRLFSKHTPWARSSAKIVATGPSNKNMKSQKRPSGLKTTAT